MYKKVSTKVTAASSPPTGTTFDVEDTTGIEIGMTLNYSGATLSDANITNSSINLAPPTPSKINCATFVATFAS